MNAVHDVHGYPRVPHVAGDIQGLRNNSPDGKPVFRSEYGIGSAVHLPRVVRHFEQLGAEYADDAKDYRAKLDRFMGDWEKWHMAEAFASPEDYFDQCLRKNAALRTLEFNAVRSDPNVIGHSITGTVDVGPLGEGLFTTFREPKPGIVDAAFDGWAPLRWCLFAEPVHIYRGAKAKLEAVLTNEDVLKPGEYPARLQVIGPNNTRVFERSIKVNVPGPNGSHEPPFALPVFSEEVKIDGPAGDYRFLAVFEKGAAAAGGEIGFYVSDPKDLPSVDTEVVLWGENAELSKWLSDHGVKVRPFTPGIPTHREVILASTNPASPGGAEAFRELASHIARGSTAVFLSPGVFKKEADTSAWIPLENKGRLNLIHGWVYPKDEWAKNHPIFDGLPAGGLMDYTFYREIIPDEVWADQDAPAEAVAAAIESSYLHVSGLMLSVNDLGAGRFILNSLHITENLGKNPAADRLLLICSAMPDGTRTSLLWRCLRTSTNR